MDEYSTSVWNDSFFRKNESKRHTTNHKILEGPVSVPLKLIARDEEKWLGQKNGMVFERVALAVGFQADPIFCHTGEVITSE